MISFIVCLFLSVGFILWIERFVLPKSETRTIFHRISLLSIMPVVMVYMTVFMASYRPFYALFFTVSAFVVVVILNNSKVKALGEPLVFSDFALLRQVILYPALYVKYIGIGNIVGVTVAVVSATVAACLLEPPVIVRRSFDDFFPTLAYLFVVLGMIYAITRGPLRGAFLQMLRRFGAKTDIRGDIDKLSLIACLIVYFFIANEISAAPASSAPPLAATPDPKGPQTFPLPSGLGTDRLPGVVVAVQNESFFDVRRLSPDIPSEILAFWDRIGQTAMYRGRLEVPAWGANTMRTEFAFLSGLPNEALGVHRFNPYLHLCKRPIWTLAHLFRALGYRTVCVHPYAADFFDRARVYPNLGFDDFIDIAAFSPDQTFGPYIGDVAVADKILSLVEDRDRPIFVFAITMENHGRWETGRLDAVAEPGESGPVLGSSELGLYIRHLANADAMLRRLVEGLRQGDAGAVLCMFGDHVPSLPQVYDQLGYQDERTDYVIWRDNGAHPREVDVTADALGRLVMDAALNQANHVPEAGQGWHAAASAAAQMPTT